jgi:hypothetical protein
MASWVRAFFLAKADLAVIAILQLGIVLQTQCPSRIQMRNGTSSRKQLKVFQGQNQLAVGKHHPLEFRLPCYEYKTLRQCGLACISPHDGCKPRPIAVLDRQSVAFILHLSLVRLSQLVQQGHANLTRHSNLNR